jgi:hypothetical protein
MEYYSVVKKQWRTDTCYYMEKPQKHDSRWEVRFRMIAPLWHVQNRQIHRERRHISAHQGMGSRIMGNDHKCKLDLFYVLCVYLFAVQYWGLNLGPILWATPLALLCEGLFFFLNRILWTVCLGWLWTVILLISASWVARITGVSHQHLAYFIYLFILVKNAMELHSGDDYTT